MSIKYNLKIGDYILCDPAIIVKKSKDGDIWIKKLWELFYKDMNHFHDIYLDSIHLYITRTAEGDGFFKEVGTDTGTLAIFEIETILNDDRFHDPYDRKGAKVFHAEEGFYVEVKGFNIYLSDGYEVITSD
jgi:hypothetical protein